VLSAMVDVRVDSMAVALVSLLSVSGLRVIQS
jgi:hypothetical protein